MADYAEGIYTPNNTETEKSFVSYLNDILNNEYRVLVKNNCPASDNSLYNDICFEPLNDLERDQKYFIILYDDKRLIGKFVVYSITWGDIFYTNDEKELIDFINKFCKAVKDNNVFEKMVKQFTYNSMKHHYHSINNNGYAEKHPNSILDKSMYDFLKETYK